MFRRLVVALSVILATGVFVTAEARKHRWRGDQLVVIAEHDIDMNLDRYTIDVSKAKGAYKGIRVKAKQGFFDLSRVQVVYADGSTHNEDRQIDMYQGERSREINPTGDPRFIDQVNITQIPQRGRGRLQVLGIQDDEGRRMDRAGGYSGRGTSSSGGGSSYSSSPAPTTSAASSMKPPANTDSRRSSERSSGSSRS